MTPSEVQTAASDLFQILRNVNATGAEYVARLQIVLEEVEIEIQAVKEGMP